jgi:lipoprotein-anchoring transpeptidase ErfK/SrfK
VARRLALVAVALVVLLGTAGCYGPGGSGITGKRIIYSIGQQRVVLVDETNTAFADFRVSGNLSLPKPGVYHVMNKKHPGRSGNLTLPYFTGFTWGPDADIGFHGIPLNPYGTPIQSEAQLGQPLSHGCVRMTEWWAHWIYDWAPIGTPVEVQG